MFSVHVQKTDHGFVATATTPWTVAKFTADTWQAAFRMASSYAFERIHVGEIKGVFHA